MLRAVSRSRAVLGMPVRCRKVPAGPEGADVDALQLAARGLWGARSPPSL